MVFEVQNVVGTTGIVANVLLSIEENNLAEARRWPQPACKLLSVLHRGQNCLETLVPATPAHAVPRNAHLPAESQG